MTEFLDFLIDPYRNKTGIDLLLEILVFVFGIVSVWYAKKGNILVYPTGLIATVISVWLMFEAGYMGDMLINVYYSVMSFYGWYVWSLKKDHNAPFIVSKTTNYEKLTGFWLFVLTLIVIFTFYMLFGYPLEWVNYLDLFISGLFFTAMYYMAHKKIENWVLWIIGDSIAVPLCFYKDLGIIGLQYVVFTIIAVFAYFEWKKISHKRPPVS